MKNKIRLGVNLDHVATLRQVRGDTTPYPDLLKQVQAVLRGGGQQITVHLREDRRHIQDKDVIALIKACKAYKVSLNLEIAATYQMLQFALHHKPHCVCFVPEKRAELTTEGGLDMVQLSGKLRRYILKLHKKDIFTSVFIEPSQKQVKASAFCRANAIELHTGRFTLLRGEKQKKEWQRLKQAAQLAYSLHLKVHAGHGLDDTTLQKVKKLPYLEEVNIGHFIVCDALNKGMENTVRKLKRILKC